jgi:glucose/arabinose dehydrogenase
MVHRVPQSGDRLGGKVLRITADGEPAPGNGAPEGFDDRIYTHGHRIPQGITLHPRPGRRSSPSTGPSCR